ncbi:hypothetical protein Enr13x_18770 [Stieleria neptunia]|uniref:Uncharacterized protein n=1 Tax=Stieleria neptunia TaxID=2527979 RepID=A0A518HMF1_9BACT|nr:hypothetical protein [Stieleria neptunia]QDV42034.1 hypothetical protein Enr13x_18770 [Stieleria neptunia]
MPFMTPNGLKIRLEEVASFNAIQQARFGTAEDVLHSTESLEMAPALLSFVGGMVAFAAGQPLWVVVATMIATQFVPRELYAWIPGWLSLSHFANPILRLVAGLAAGYYFAGWNGSLTYFAGMVGAFVLPMMLTPLHISMFGMTQAERSFLLACAKHGVPKSAIDAIFDENGEPDDAGESPSLVY